MRLAERNHAYHPGTYPLENTMCVPSGDIVDVMTFARKIHQLDCYAPVVHSAELVAVTSTTQDTVLRLVLIGQNIFQICLAESSFDLGFPFGRTNPTAHPWK